MCEPQLGFIAPRFACALFLTWQKDPIRSKMIVKHGTFLTWSFIFPHLVSCLWISVTSDEPFLVWAVIFLFVVQKSWLFYADIPPGATLPVTAAPARCIDRNSQLQETCTFIFNLVSLILNLWGGWENPHPPTRSTRNQPGGRRKEED